MQIMEKEQVTHECVNLNILAEIPFKIFSFCRFSRAQQGGKENFLQSHA